MLPHVLGKAARASRRLARARAQLREALRRSGGGRPGRRFHLASSRHSPPRECQAGLRPVPDAPALLWAPCGELPQPWPATLLLQIASRKASQIFPGLGSVCLPRCPSTKHHRHALLPPRSVRHLRPLLTPPRKEASGNGIICAHFCISGTYPNIWHTVGTKKKTFLEKLYNDANLKTQ